MDFAQDIFTYWLVHTVFSQERWERLLRSTQEFMCEISSIPKVKIDKNSSIDFNTTLITTPNLNSHTLVKAVVVLRSALRKTSLNQNSSALWHRKYVLINFIPPPPVNIIYSILLTLNKIWLLFHLPKIWLIKQ